MIAIFIVLRRRALGVVALLLCAVLFFWAAGRPALPAASPAEAATQVPIIMYHSLLLDPASAGPYVLSPLVLEADFQWLQAHGYTAVSLGQVIDFVDGLGTLPQKPVVITFDDGHLNNLTYLPQLLEQYDFCATISVVGEFSELYTRHPDPNPAYAYLTWEDIAQLSQSERIEIGNHTYYAHSRIPLDAGARADYGGTLVDDAQAMARALKERSGVTAQVYAYPYGFVIKGADRALKGLGFRASLSCNQRINAVRVGDGQCLYSMGRFNRPSGPLSEDFFVGVVGLE